MDVANLMFTILGVIAALAFSVIGFVIWKVSRTPLGEGTGPSGGSMPNAGNAANISNDFYSKM